MGILRRVINKCRAYMNPVKYAKSIGVKIGEGAVLQPAAWGSEPWLIKLGSNVQLSGNVQFVTHDGGTFVFKSQEKYKNVIRYGAIEIKDNCFIGLRVIIMPGVTIEPNSVVGAGSVVTKDVPPNTVYAGNPAHFICTIENYAEKCYMQTPDYDKACLSF